MVWWRVSGPCPLCPPSHRRRFFVKSATIRASLIWINHRHCRTVYYSTVLHCTVLPSVRSMSQLFTVHENAAIEAQSAISFAQCISGIETVSFQFLAGSVRCWGHGLTGNLLPPKSLKEWWCWIWKSHIRTNWTQCAIGKVCHQPLFHWVESRVSPSNFHIAVEVDHSSFSPVHLSRRNPGASPV